MTETRSDQTRDALDRHIEAIYDAAAQLVSLVETVPGFGDGILARYCDRDEIEDSLALLRASWVIRIVAEVLEVRGDRDRPDVRRPLYQGIGYGLGCWAGSRGPRVVFALERDIFPGIDAGAKAVAVVRRGSAPFGGGHA